MDSTLVVCYSYTGAAGYAAQLLCTHRGWPLGEIFDDAPRDTLRCLLDSVLRRRPPMRYEGPPPGEFRTVVLVSPIWMERLAGPVRSFLHDHRDALARVAVVITGGSRNASAAASEVGAIVGRAPLRTMVLTQREFDDGSATSNVLAFGDALQTGTRTRWLGDPEPVLMVH